MKNITLNFCGLGYGKYFQAYVEIYDENNNIVFNGMTFNGKLNLFLKLDTSYRVFAQSCGEYVNSTFYVKDNYNNYKFYFNRCIQENENTITLLLTDYYYNLPIEKGEIILG